MCFLLAYKADRSTYSIKLRVSQLANSSVTTFDAERGKFYLAHWFGISIAIFAGQADAAFLQRAALMNAHWTKHYPTKRTNVTFVLNGVPLPTAEARAAFEAQRKSAMGIVNFGIVVEGVRAALVNL